MKQPATTLLRSIGSFLSWWILELRAVLDDLRSHLAPRWRKSLAVFVSRSRLQVVDGDPGTSSPVLDLPRTQSGSEPTPNASEAQTATFAHGRRAHVVFDPELAFIRSLRLPLAAAAHLDSAIDLQKPKLLPMDAALLRTDFEIVAVDQESGSVDIELAALKRADIEPIETVIEQWGLQLGTIHLGRASDSRLRFKFGASDTRAGRFATSRADGLWLASAVTLLFGAVAVFAVQAVRAEKSLAQAVGETSTEAASVLEQRQQLISRLETLALIAQSERTPTAGAILADVTTHLDRDAWLTNFELKGSDLRLVGLSSDAAKVVKGLAASSLIINVELRSSTSIAAGLNTGRDRFEITAQVKTST